MSTKKITNYFPHDFNAAQNDKLKCMMDKYKALGYGIYWRIVENLHSKEEHRIELKPFFWVSLSSECGTTIEFLKEFISYCTVHCELFSSDGTYLECDRVYRNIAHMEDSRRNKAEAGRKGGIAKAERARQDAAGTTDGLENQAPELSDSNKYDNLPINSPMNQEHENTAKSSTATGIRSSAINNRSAATPIRGEATNNCGVATPISTKRSIIDISSSIKSQEDIVLSDRREESKGVWGKNGVSQNDFSKNSEEINNGDGYKNANGGATNGHSGAGEHASTTSTGDYLREQRKRRAANVDGNEYRAEGSVSRRADARMSASG